MEQWFAAERMKMQSASGESADKPKKVSEEDIGTYEHTDRQTTSGAPLTRFLCKNEQKTVGKPREAEIEKIF